MKLLKKLGKTSQIWQVFIQDSSSTTGAGLTGLVFNSSSLTAYFHRDTDTTATAISLVTMTVGTFTSGGFKEIDAANMPGFYQFCPPNTALATGAESVGFMLKGAANMAPLAIEVQLTAIDVDSAATFMTGVNGLAPPANWNAMVISAGGIVSASLDAIKSSALGGTAAQLSAAFVKWFNVAAPTGTVNSIPDAVAGATNGLFIAGTNAATTITTALTTTFTGNLTGSVGSVLGNVAGNVVGSVGSVLGNIAGTVASVVGNVGGNVVGSVGSVLGAVGSVLGNIGGNLLGNVNGNVVGSVDSVTNPVTVGTNNDKTGYSLTSAYDPAKTAAQAGDAMRIVSGTGTNEVSLSGGKVILQTSQPGVTIPTVTTVTALSQTNLPLGAVPAATASIIDQIRWNFILARNKITQTSSVQTAFADDGVTPVAAATVSDDGTTATRGEFA